MIRHTNINFIYFMCEYKTYNLTKLSKLDLK